MEPIARRLYQEIGLIEEEHVTHYEWGFRTGKAPTTRACGG
ncbi:hypothetical protein ACFQ8S_03030 [Streptomyces virginiae]